MSANTPQERLRLLKARILKASQDTSNNEYATLMAEYRQLLAELDGAEVERLKLVEVGSYENQK